MTNYQLLYLLLSTLAMSTTALQPPSSRRQQPRPQQSIATTPVVICPGFGNDRIDYYEPLQQSREVG